jgi:hypothetical protein
MDASNKSIRDSGEELFDFVIKVVAVWGTALTMGTGLSHLLMDIASRGWRLAISSIVTLVIASALMQACTLWPRFGRAFYVWRYPIAILVAVYVGYQWHAYDYPRSQEGQINEATRWACAKSPSCQKAAVDYLVGGDGPNE